jgi:hypothetical protein
MGLGVDFCYGFCVGEAFDDAAAVFGESLDDAFWVAARDALDRWRWS